MAAHPNATTYPLGTRANWQTTLERQHPLVGRIWDCKRRAYVDADAVWQRLRSARMVLLGEMHDNPDHHRLQAAAIAALVAGGRRPAVAMEMFDREQQGAIDQYRAEPAARAAGLKKATRWDETGWPAFEMYFPIFEIAFQHRLAIIAANLPLAQVRAVTREGTRALGHLLGPLGLDRPFPVDLEASLRDELRASHCGHLPESMLEPMAMAQHARDAHMARTLIDADRGDGAVLIAGTGHVRLERGVPFYIHQQSPTTPVVSIAWLEVVRGVQEPAAYANPLGAGDLPFDFVWFTPRSGDADPCAAFGR